MEKLRTSAWVLAGLAALLLAGPASAQEETKPPTLKQVLEGSAAGQPPPATAPAKEPAPGKPPPPRATPAQLGPVDDFDRGVPRSSVLGFLKAGRARDWERAAEYLDLRNLPEDMSHYEPGELAHSLKAVLDNALWIDADALSERPEGHADDGLPRYRDRVGVIDTPGGKFEVLLQRVPRGDGAFIWKFSNRTVKDLPVLWEHHGYSPGIEWLINNTPAVEFAGQAVWQWLGMVLLLVVAFGFSWLLSLLLVQILRRRKRRSAELERLIAGPAMLLIAVLLFREFFPVLRPTLTLRALMATQTLPIIFGAWVAIRAFDLFFDRMIARMREQAIGTVVFVGPLRTLARTAIVLVSGLVWLDNAGFHITTLVAGLGVGGIAVALGAQKSFEDVFAAVTLYSSRPVSAGDFCRVGDTLGVVEEIGLRWTRIRTLGDTMVSMPNGEFAKQRLENYAERQKIWYHPRLSLRYETTPDQLRYILVEVRKLLYSHPKLLNDPARIRFVEFGDSSLDLDVFAYVDTRDYGEFLEVSEDLNLRVMQIVRDAGSDFALPSQTTYVEQGAGVDAERSRAAERQVAEWRDKGELFLPSFPADQVERLSGSLRYPPEGAPA